MSGTAVEISQNTLGASLVESEPTHLAHPDSMRALDSLWWTWDASADGFLSLSAVSPNTENGQGFILELFRELSDGSLIKVASDESVSVIGRPLGANVRAGERYYISFSNSHVPSSTGCWTRGR